MSAVRPGSEAEPSHGFDWPALMRVGITGLGLSPDVFWALTPGELRLLMGPPPEAPMDRTRLSDLMRAFPDNGPKIPPRETVHT